MTPCHPGCWGDRAGLLTWVAAYLGYCLGGIGVAAAGGVLDGVPGAAPGVLGAPGEVLVAAGGVLVAAGGVLVAAGGVLVAAGGVLVAAGGVLVVPTPGAHPLDADEVALPGAALVVRGAPEPDIEGKVLVEGVTVLAVVVPAVTDGKQLPVVLPACVLDGSVAVLAPAVPVVVAVPPGVGKLEGIVLVWGVLVIGPGVPGAVLLRGVAIVTGAVLWAGFVAPAPIFVPVPVCVPAAGGAAVPGAPVCAAARPSANTIITARMAGRILILVSPALSGSPCSDGLPPISDVPRQKPRCLLAISHRKARRPIMAYNPGPAEPKQTGSMRDPRAFAQQACAVREKMLDKTIADSFPTSDPPSSIPDPTSDSFDAEEAIESPYDRRSHAENKEAERQPLPGDKPFDRQPQPEKGEEAA